MLSRLSAPVSLLFVCVSYVYSQATSANVDYRKEIQPILTGKCVACHQGKTAPAELQLDTPEGLLKGGTSGKAVIPGSADKSLLISRISDTSNNRMPPGGSVTAEQIALIKTWINQGANADPSVDFVTQVQPIFKASCYACHSGNDPKADLHLDNRALALKGAKSGLVILPGNSKDSRLVHRISGDGAEPRMPLVGNPLTEEQIAVLRKWIDQGAVWPDGTLKATHWAYLKPVRPPVPAVNNAAWIRNPIDNFILARLEKEGLHPSPEASKETLVRRLYLDIVGLPPSPAEVDENVNDTRADSYDRLVDKLLASPHYGERMATPWLDMARYGDSNGYERDFQRVAWPYRDWIVKAFNENKPFDQFTIEQLAGDLLPNATIDQRVATGFVRGAMLNTEGGTDPEEQNWVAQVDRAITVGNVWLGSTTQCSQCHNHKYDPFTQKQFYQMVAFFNNSKFFPPSRNRGYGANGTTMGDFISGPYTEARIDLPTPEQAAKRDEINKQIKSVTEQLEANTPEYQKLEAAWEDSMAEADRQWQPLRAQKLASQGGSTLTQSTDGSILVSGKNPDNDIYVIDAKSPVSGQITGIRIVALPHASLPHDGPGRDYYGNFIVSEVKVESGSSPQNLTTVPIKELSADNVFNFVVEKDENGNRVWRSDVSRESIRLPKLVLLIPEKPFVVDSSGSLRITISQLSTFLGVGLGNFRVSVTTSANPKKLLEVTDQLRALFSIPQEQRPGYLAKVQDVVTFSGTRRGIVVEKEDPLMAQWRRVAPELAPLRQKIGGFQRQIADLKIPSTLVLTENLDVNHPRGFVHERGAFTAKAEEVEADVPSFLGSLPKDAPPNRLGLAKWLVGPDNPLTARVRVNQIWQMIFGMGIVETAEDFGTQGFPPSHPDLLDWLATEFMNGWDQKALIRMIVTSSAYRQSSKATPELLERDPKNALLAHGPRFRVEAEMVRDIALTASGLLSRKLGGPAVMPPQPEGMWNIPFQAADDKWVTSKGEDRYRRGLYIFIRRTVRYPSLTVFDAPPRETTTVRRTRSNTPLQALTTLNDPAFFETAQAMANRIEKEGGNDTPARATYGFRLVTSRRPSSNELSNIVDAYETERRYFAANLKEAETVSGKMDSELAAWTMISNSLLNLDETVTKE